MVLYICNKCNKHFTRKQCYDVHINRKFPCSYEKIYEEINDQKIDNNKIKELENKLLEVEKENNIFKGENNTLKELLNNKDIEIKDLYKNIYNKTKDNDIKIKKIQEYVYIIRECDFVRLNENIYKIGRTSKTNPEDRFQKYRSEANYENFSSFHNFKVLK